MAEKFDAARMVAKLLAARPTPLEEVPQVIANVQRALAVLDEESPAPRVARTPRPRRAAPARSAPPDAPHASAAPNTETEPKAAAPTLVRRAELAAQAPAEPATQLAPTPAGAIRGVVQWFDSRAGHGALRLPGFSRDVSVDAATLASFGVARLFKGQEIEATLEGAGEHTRLASLRLVNAAPATPVSGGTVHDRHAKMVVVELKNQPQRRNAARAEAELLLSARRAPK
jgi:cold shock CspA family protein